MNIQSKYDGSRLLYRTETFIVDDESLIVPEGDGVVYSLNLDRIVENFEMNNE